MRTREAQSPVVPDAEMYERIRGFDWSRTRLGPASDWPTSLKTMVGVALGNRFPMLVWWGPEFIQIYNDGYRVILGDKHPAALGRSGAAVWAEIWDVVGPLAQSVLDGGPSTWSERLLLMVNRKGFVEETYFTFSYSPVPDDDGEVGGVLVTVKEVTEEVQDERQLRMLRDLAAPGGDDRSVEVVCRSALDVLGANDRDLPFALLYLVNEDGPPRRIECGVAGGATDDIGARASLDVAPDRWPLDEVARSGRDLVLDDLESRIGSPPPGGSLGDAPNQAIVLPLARTGQAPYGFLVAGVSPHRPLDERYRGLFRLAADRITNAIASARAYEDERARAESLAELDRAKTIFFSNISHEFRTPLTLILGPMADALASGALRGADLATSYRNAVRLLKLVNGLLDFARIEAGRMAASYRPTDVATLTAELASVFRSAVERAGLRLDVDCPPLRRPVYVDPEMWEKVVLNLLSNALKFTFEGAIRVAVREQEDAMLLEVADRGVGIPDQEVARLFERFHRIEGTRARTHEGSGIGLALVHELVRLHGGSIGVESRLGSGTTFTVRIPFGHAHLPADRVAEEPRPATPGANAAAFVEESLRWLPDSQPTEQHVHSSEGEPHAAGPADARILVADDNADMRAYVTRLLGRWTVEAVADGSQALAAARRQRPDLILADVMMPELDGYGLVEALRKDERTRSIPIVLVSARAGEEARIEGITAGADDYLVKPFSARELVARVTTQIELGRLRGEIERQREELHSLFAGAPAAIAVLKGPRHVFEFANAQYGHLTGRAPSDLVGREVTEMFPELVGSQTFGVLDAVYASGIAAHHPEIEIRWDRERNGTLVTAFLDWTCQPVLDATGRVAGTAQFFFDVTDRVRNREMLEEARAIADAARGDAESATRAKDEFLAMLGHELRNPLSPIVTALQLMSMRGDASQEREIIERQVAHLVRLVDDLLDVARITQGKLELRMRTVELSEVVTRGIETASHLLEQRNHVLDVRVPAQGLMVHGDPDRLAQVLSNLVTNAAKYSMPRSRIEVTAEAVDGRVRLAVRDEGMGIESDMLDSIFELFVQHRRTLDRSKGGMGLGLAIVRSLVQAHGGTVVARSDGPGCGSTFVVELPLAAAESAADPAGAGAAHSEAPSQSPRRILIVDDNEDAAMMLAQMLEALGHVVKVATDGPSALRTAKGLEPQIALLDLGLPVMDGYELARRLREQHGPDLTLIAVTGYGQKEDRARSGAAGFGAHLVKPIDVRALTEVMTNPIRR